MTPERIAVASALMDAGLPDTDDAADAVIEALRVRGYRVAALEPPAEAEHNPDGYLISCPWCQADMRGKIAWAQMIHLIDCGDKYRGEARRHAAALEKPTEGAEQIAHFMPKDDCEHDFQGWRDFPEGNGGERFCSKCGLGAMSHSLRNSP